MNKAHIGAQLFSVCEHTQTPADVARSLKRLADIGYRTVQVSGMGPIAEQDLKAICDDNGLVICSTHEPGDALINQTRAVIDRLSALGCSHTAYPHPHVRLDSLDAVKKLAADLSRAGREMSAAGVTLAYHNHAIELPRFEGRTILDWLLADMDPVVEMELDTYWVQMGGGDPLAWVNKVAGRQSLVHLKDADQDSPTAPLTWAERLKRVFDIDISVCPLCGGTLRVIADVTDPDVIQTIPVHLKQRAPPGAGHRQTPLQAAQNDLFAAT